MRRFRSAQMQMIVNGRQRAGKDPAANTDSERMRESNGYDGKCPVHWRRLARDEFCVT